MVWALWLSLTMATGAALAERMTSVSRSKEIFLPGKTTHGHYQIELACAACHKEDFTAAADFQVGCVECHGAELEKVEDSHPQTKFTDPRNAARVEELDARFCVTCHTEHQPARTGTMGLSLPGDYCYHCHEDVAEERPTHQGLAFDSCADAGCHNFHDNKALYEDYLVRHGREPMLIGQPLRTLDAENACPAPERRKVSEKGQFDACKSCHEAESASFVGGRHGMRLAQGLSPMTPALARLPMKEAASHRELTCSTCHELEEGSSPFASEVRVCESCHADEHTRSYRNSKHFEFLELELAGKMAKGSGVTCATCHMPRLKNEDGELWVNHNQNDTLRPNEKMIRSACGTCHGLPFAINSLADSDLVAKNFTGQPAKHIESVNFALSRE
jgi:hypothetical protein